jgi:hypothetical protein
MPDILHTQAVVKNVNSAQQLAALLLEDEGAWDFTSRIERRQISVTGEDGSWYLQNADVVVNWHLDMDVRSWGLKEANPIIKSISARLFFEVDNELEGGQNTEEVVELNYPSPETPAGPAGDTKAAAMRYHSHVSAEVEMKRREEMYGGIQCVPVEIEIDLRTNKMVVFFQS